MHEYELSVASWRALALSGAGRRPAASTLGIIGIVAALSAGCSGAQEGSSEGERLAPSTLSATVLHEFDVGEVRYRFVDASEGLEPSVLLEQDAPLRVGSATPLAQLLTEHPDLTTLEVYLALSPNAATPAEQLVVSHTIEAALLGRADDAIREVTFEPRLLVEKSLATCKTIVSNFLRDLWSETIVTSGMAGRVGGNSNFAYAYAFGNVHDHTQRPVAVGLCNDSQSGAPISKEIDRMVGGEWSVILTGTLNPDRWHAWRWGSTSFHKNLYAIGQTQTNDLTFQAAGAYGQEFIH